MWRQAERSMINIFQVMVFSTFFSRRHVTTPCHVGWSVGPLVCPSDIFELRAVFALPLQPNRPRLDCRVSGLVYKKINLNFFHFFLILRKIHNKSILIDVLAYNY